MITQLTKEQESRMAEYRDKWTAIGLSTEPANRTEAELAIVEMYAAAGLAAPRVVWCGSPLSQGLTRAVLMDKRFASEIGKHLRESVRESVRASVRESVRASVGASVRESVGASVRASVRESVGVSVWASVGESVGESVWASVWESVGESVGESVWESVWASVWESVGESVGASVGDSSYGQHDANWLAFFEYFRQVCALTQQTDKLNGLTRLARAAGWALPHEKICWVCERHNILNRDENGRLHSESSAALAYPDGFQIHAFHGVRVQPYVIEKPETITVDDVSKEQNSEVRRIKIERMGVGRFVRESNAECIEIDDHKFNGTRALFRSQLGTWLHCACPSTARTYWMDVPAECKTCEEADAYLRGSVNGRMVGAT